MRAIAIRCCNRPVTRARVEPFWLPPLSPLDDLLGNAVVHANEHGSIRVVAEPELAGILIRITNSGSQIRAEQLEHIFELFWRGDEARSTNGTHAGLGLSECKKLVESLGGQISASSTFTSPFECG